jgi:hypothetical protein
MLPIRTVLIAAARKFLKVFVTLRMAKMHQTERDDRFSCLFAGAIIESGDKSPHSKGPRQLTHPPGTL